VPYPPLTARHSCTLGYKYMRTFETADTLHRLVKHALDSGQAASIAEARALFAGYRLALRLDEARAGDADQQAALLTAVALGRRVFLGGVTVAAPPEVSLNTPMPLGRSLGEAVTALGGVLGDLPPDIPLVEIGASSRPRERDFHIRTSFTGWCGGILPAHLDSSPAPRPTMPLAPMLSAALAINEAFLFVSGSMCVAGRRSVGMSLWNPSGACDWFASQADEPQLQVLPARLWLIGLGHLGQAYLWALSLLPYAAPTQVGLVLQDVDVITPSTESTSILSDGSMIGQKKTRAMATWAEQRGFVTCLCERLFDPRFTRHPDEPAVALCGLDNGLGRQALDQVGFDFAVEAGLGRGHQDFRSIRLHTLPASRSAASIWQTNGAPAELLHQPAYAGMLTRGELDRCGVTLLAGKAVGAPFVGAVAASLAIAEILRLLHGGPVHELIDLDLKAPEYRTAVVTSRDFNTLNPGFVPIDAR
jgi:hypothetical protein